MANQIIEGFRLSPQQQRLWQLIKEDGASRYCARCAFMLDGELDVHTLQVSIQDVIARHEILRTRLESVPGMKLPLQVIDDHVNIAIDVEPDAQTASIDELFTGSSSDQLETRLLVLGPNKHLLFFSLPAFCADGLSLRNLMHDLGQSYEARIGLGEVGEEPMQYADFSGWQNDLLESAEAEVGKLYWRKRDLSETAALKLPFERSSANTQEVVTHSQEQKIESATIDALAIRYNASVSTVLLAAWYALLWRLTGQTDLLIGVAHDGRRHEELSSVIGPIAKYLPLACVVDDFLSRSSSSACVKLPRKLDNGRRFLLTSLTNQRSCHSCLSMRNVPNLTGSLIFSSRCIESTSVLIDSRSSCRANASLRR